MPTINRLPSGFWRVQVRAKQNYVSKTFRLKADAQRWAMEQEDRLANGQTVSKRDTSEHDTIGGLIGLHLADMAEVGKAAQRSKEATLFRLKEEIGSIKLANFTRERIIEFGRARAKQGAGPVTVAMDFSYLGTVLSHAAAIYGYEVPSEQLRLARIALLRLGLVGKPNERDRRPTEAEIKRLLAYFDFLGRQVLPMSRLVKFAIASAMRQEEITRILWDDFKPDGPSVLIRQRKHPRNKSTNN